MLIVKGINYMEEERIRYLNNLIDDLKVVSYEEHDVLSNSSFIKIKSGKYKLNNNEVIERERVAKRSGYLNAVVVFAVTVDKKILMVIQPRVFLPMDKRVTVEFPAGYIDGNEEVVEAAKRELVEETGYVSNNFELIDSYYPSLGYSGEKISIVLATDCEKKDTQHLDSDEFINCFIASFDELKYLLENNYIVDATTKLTYYEVLDYLKKNNMFNIIGGSLCLKKEKRRS